MQPCHVLLFQWIESLNLDPATVNDTTRVCGAHFCEDDFQVRENRIVWYIDRAFLVILEGKKILRPLKLFNTLSFNSSSF